MVLILSSLNDISTTDVVQSLDYMAIKWLMVNDEEGTSFTQYFKYKIDKGEFIKTE